MHLWSVHRREGRAISQLADLVTVVMARHFARYQVAAVVGPTSAVAAEVARRVYAPSLAVVGAMTALDTRAGPALMRQEWGALPSERHDIRDLFALVAQGRVAIFTSPAQVDTSGRANLGAIGGWHRPRLALTGSRGLPDIGASLPGFAFWLPSTRALVPAVDYVSAPPPPPGNSRVALTLNGVFLITSAGWTCISRHGDPWQAPPFPVAGLFDAPATEPPTSEEAAALTSIDQANVRRIEVGG